jgi:hypothetical protein
MRQVVKDIKKFSNLAFKARISDREMTILAASFTGGEAYWASHGKYQDPSEPPSNVPARNKELGLTTRHISTDRHAGRLLLEERTNTKRGRPTKWEIFSEGFS